MNTAEQNVTRMDKKMSTWNDMGCVNGAVSNAGSRFNGKLSEASTKQNKEMFP